MAPTAAGGPTTGVLAPTMRALLQRRPHRLRHRGAMARAAISPAARTRPITGVRLSATGRRRPASPGVPRGARSP
eukprot:10489808-Alexandrium_andersonii.AAC.1